MRILVASMVLTVLAGSVRAGDAPANPAFTGPVTDKSRVCMMQDSLQPRSGTATEHEGKQYWFCCPMCLESFATDPARYAHARDPVNGAVVDKASAPAYAVQGKVYFFSSDETLGQFSRDPERYLKAARDSVSGPGRTPPSAPE